MTRRDTLKLLGLLGLRAVLPAGIAFARPRRAEDSVMATATRQFGCRLFDKLRAKSGNLIYSPLSIETALAMAAQGARGDTRDEMDQVLQLANPEQRSVAGEYLRNLQSNPDSRYELSIANALWGQQGLPFRQSCLDETQKDFGATLHPVDFKQTEQARQTINHWVADNTKNKIPELFDRGSLSPAAMLVLTNAVYFKGKWAEPFDKKLTKDEPFHVTSDKTTQAPLMRRRGRYRYFANEVVQAVDLPYAGDKLSMLVILPAAPDAEKDFNAANLRDWVAKLASKPGEVILPRFKVTDEFNLSQTLQDMGMKLAFTGNADFGGMCADRLMISSVIHKAFVETNEEGSEAAAATGVTMIRASVARPEEPFTFRADRPFLFVIRDITTNTPLFVGRVMNPVA
jgi:serpin B